MVKFGCLYENMTSYQILKKVVFSHRYLFYYKKYKSEKVYIENL